MTERQAHIISALIHEYVRTAEPVASSVLAGSQRLPYSSATIRTELAALEEQGYLCQPHTSAGRIPTDRGYRFYVDRQMRKREFSENQVERMQRRFEELQTKHRRLARAIVRLLAALSQNLAIAGVLDTDELYEAGLQELLGQPEFSEAERLLDVSRLLDALDQNFDQLQEISMDEPQIYIGEENPYAKTRNVSMVVTTCELPSGERGLFAIIGPTRMRYDRNVSILRMLRQQLERE